MTIRPGASTGPLTRGLGCSRFSRTKIFSPSRSTFQTPDIEAQHRLLDEAAGLVEAGVRFVNVTWDLFWDRIQIDYDAWDTHQKNFPILRDNKLPGLDQTYSALMEDLEVRGLLD